MACLRFTLHRMKAMDPHYVYEEDDEDEEQVNTHALYITCTHACTMIVSAPYMMRLSHAYMHDTIRCIHAL